MTVDKKSQHVGNHGGTYVDQDGMSRQFTYIDHDKKPKVFVNSQETDLSPLLTEYRESIVKRIMKISPSICPFEFSSFTNRGDSIEWDSNMLNDKGVPLDVLRNLNTILENRMELL